MTPKQVVATVIILNLIFLGFFYVVTQTTFLDYWHDLKSTPDLCTQQAADGGTVFSFCDTPTLEPVSLSK